MTRIVLKSASKCLLNGAILPDADIAWEGGRIYGIVAEDPSNRADKSALIRLLRGEISAGEGSYSLEPADGKIGVLAKMPGFLPFLGAYGNLRLMRAPGLERADIEAAIEAVGLKDSLKDRVGSYSPDMIARLALAQLLLPDPDLIILDADVLYPDADTAERIRELLFAERNCGKLIVIFSRSEEYLLSTCDEIHRVQGSVLRRSDG